MNNRYELKYIIPTRARSGFHQRIAEWLRPDAHGADGVYRVTSLYFDSPDFECYWQKIDGVAIRRKIRLRYYEKKGAQQFDVGSAFLEVKHRVHNTLFKQRVRLSTDGAKSLLDGESQLSDWPTMMHDSQPRVPDISALTDHRVLTTYRPAALITYVRHALVGVSDNNLRVTFDSDCQSEPPQSRHLDVDQKTGHVMLTPCNGVLEIKFDHAIPRWIRDCLRDARFRLDRFSKYAAGIDALASTTTHPG